MAPVEFLERLREALRDRYRVDREIGRGGMATVYLAHDPKHGRSVALKVLRPEVAASVGAQRFLQEIQIAAGLNHPHILPLHDSGEAGGFLYFVMPYVAGESLRERLNREEQLPVAEALHIAREVADALDYAHRHNIVHRDIKPENILMVEGHALVADFGIARAIRVARGGERATEAGMAVGTPEYMSPEQAGGRQEPDGRSDIYALGCVLYEMLAGQPPFMDESVSALAARHLSDAPAPLRMVRATVPVELEQVVETALAKAPADRYQTAKEFADALPVISGPRVIPTPVVSPRAQRVAILASATVLVGMALVAVPKLFEGASLDPNLFVVVPFGHLEGAAPSMITGDQCERLLNEAFGRWADIRYVDPLVAADRRARRGATPRTLEGAFAEARVNRAGRLVWGRVWQQGDTVHVDAGLYRVARGGGAEPERRSSIRIPTDSLSTLVGLRFNQLADTLLLGAAASAASVDGAAGTRLYAAWQAYDSAHAALRLWNLDSAKAALARAVVIDPAYPHALFWLAQVMSWAGDAAPRWRELARRAVAEGARLSRRDRLAGQALLAVADSDYAAACRHYRALLARDSTDFAAWFGLGECNAKDPVVLRDPRSPSGWRFRGSYHTAAQAYSRALEVVPSFQLAFRERALAQLPKPLLIESNTLRGGDPLPPDTGRFVSYPSLDHDTLAFIPFPLMDVIRGEPRATPTTTVQAVERNQQRLREVTTSWIASFPASPDAFEAHARVLEAMGEISPGEAPNRSALAAVLRARTLATDPSQALRLAVKEAQLQLKAGRFARARELADSLLGAFPDPQPLEAKRLAVLAAFTGRVYRAAALLPRALPVMKLRGPSGDSIPVTPELGAAASALLVYAAVGAPADSILALERRVDRLVRSWVGPARAEVVRRAALSLPVMLSFPVLGLQPEHGVDTNFYYLRHLQAQLSRGDTAAVRERFRWLEQGRREERPGGLSIDYRFQEAWIQLAAGDTAQVVEQLDLVLDALPTFGTDLLFQMQQAPALVRTMALRADLADAQGDAATAARWAGVVVTFWRDADAPLQPTVQRMQRFARRAH